LKKLGLRSGLPGDRCRGRWRHSSRLVRAIQKTFFLILARLTRK
jgi:hypothetical protein